MNTIELEAGKMELVQVIANINSPETLAKARRALSRVISSAKTIKEQEFGDVPALQFTEEQLIAELQESEDDRQSGRFRSSEDVFRSMEEKYPFLCK